MKKLKIQKNLEFALILSLFPLLLGSCSSQGRKIQELMNRYQSSINDRKAEEFLGCFAPGYPDSLLFGEPTQERIGKELNSPGPAKLVISDQKVEISSDQAKVSQQYLFSRITEGKAGQDQGREELILRRDSSGWRIVSGSMLYQILAGRKQEEERIKAVLEKRIRALREKNPELFRELVDPEYNFKGKDFAGVMAEMDQTFQNYEQIELILDPPKITFFPGRADLVEGFRLKAWSQGQLKEFNDTERLELRKTGPGWKISKGL